MDWIIDLSIGSKLHQKIGIFLLVCVSLSGPANVQGQTIRRPADLKYILNEDGQPCGRNGIRIPEHLTVAVREAEVELLKDENKDYGALIYSVLSDDDKLREANVRLGSARFRKGHPPRGTVIEDDPVVEILGHRSGVDMTVTAEGYQTFSRKTIIRAGEITIWDDILLEPFKPGEAATIQGTVKLEDNADPSDIFVYIDNRGVRTKKDGRFFFDNVREGQICVRAHSDDYKGMEAVLQVKKGAQEKCELVGYRARSARVRWAYQPDGSRDFTRGITSGEATISSSRFCRISFGEGFISVPKESDFFVDQKEDKLFTRSMDQSGSGTPACAVIKNTRLDQVREAPGSEYESHKSIPLKPGRVYVYKCYDGKHYAKLEVLEIIDELPDADSDDD